MQRSITESLSLQNSNAINRDFYDLLWSESQLVRPERFNTWPLISELLPLASTRLACGRACQFPAPIS